MVKDPRPHKPGSREPDEVLDLLRALARSKAPRPSPPRLPPGGGEEKLTSSRRLPRGSTLSRARPPRVRPATPATTCARCRATRRSAYPRHAARSFPLGLPEARPEGATPPAARPRHLDAALRRPTDHLRRAVGRGAGRRRGRRRHAPSRAARPGRRAASRAAQRARAADPGSAGGAAASTAAGAAPPVGHRHATAARDRGGHRRHPEKHVRL